MLKISVVLLTTTFFAGLLIVDPYGSAVPSFQTAAGKVQAISTVKAVTPVAAAATVTVVQPKLNVTEQDTLVVAMAEAEPDMLTAAQPAFGIQHHAEKPQRERVVQGRLRRHV